MNLNDVNWIDSQLKKITIEYDKAKLLVECDSGNYVITCTGLIGLTNLCIWDDTIIEKTQAVSLAKQGGILGVGIAHRGDTEYLKAIPDGSENNNLSSLPTVK